MSYFTDKYSDLRPILADYMNNIDRGVNVADYYLTTVNRAQKNLWAKKPWCDLSTDLNMSIVNNSCVLPADFGRIVKMYADLDGTGASWYPIQEGMNYWRGYKMRDSFTKSAGHAWVITFNYAQNSAVKMVYQRLLSNFTGEGIEYLFFPLNLLLLECQKIYLREKGSLNELKSTEIAFSEEFKDYCNCHQWVNFDDLATFNDRDGMPVSIDGYSLDGSCDTGKSYLPRSFLR